MNLRKIIFIVGGCILIFVILSYRFGLFKKIKENMNKPTKTVEVAKANTTKKQAETTSKNVAVEEKQEQPKDLVADVKTPVKVAEVKSDDATAETKVDTAETTTKNIEENAQKAKEILLQDLGVGNPFDYSSTTGGSYTPGSSRYQVGALSIKGIINMKGQEPMAILQLHDNNMVYYVKKDDVIRLNIPSKTASLVTETYIVVKEIRPDEVELVQQERPDKVIIIR